MEHKISGCREAVIVLEIGAYFETLKLILMTATFIALVLIFLYILNGKKEEKTD